MKTNLLSTFILSLAFTFAASVGAAASARVPDGWHSGVGASMTADPAKAGAEAALKAKEGLDGVPAKVVVVLASGPMLTPELIEGVKKHFAAEIIYGGEVTSPWTPEGNSKDATSLDAETGVGVWALGGGVDVKAAAVSTVDKTGGTKDPYYEAGMTIAESMKEFMETNQRPGKLLLTWGDQYNGSNKEYARGLNDGFGRIWPITGGASGNAEADVIVEGKIVRATNVGLALAGDFRVALSMGKGPHTPKTTEQALSASLNEGDGEEPFFGFIVNCRRRRLGLMADKNLGPEHEQVVKMLSGNQFFGFYGPGEVGATSTGKAPEGVGFSVVTALLYAL